MTKYLTLPFNKKLNLLREHSLSGEWPDLDHENWCLHCGRKFSGHAARVWQAKDGSLWLECGTPSCNGSPIDWAPYPWWDPKHPATKAHLKKSRAAAKKKPKSRGGESSKAADDDIPF